MAFGGPVPGGQSLSPAMAAALKQGLASQAPPPNPKTPNDRTDPRESQLLNLQRVRRAMEILRDGIPDGDPLHMFVAALHSAITKLRDGVQPETVVQTLLAALAPPPMMSPPPMMPGGSGMPGMGGPPPMPGQASTAGGPPPVSPGLPVS